MNATLPAYAELHCLSNFSFLRGASHPEELVRQAAKQHYAALALTDECSVAGVVRAHLQVQAINQERTQAYREAQAAVRQAGRDPATVPPPQLFKLIIGSELRLQSGPTLVLLARNRAGYGQLCTLITRGRRSADKGQYHLTTADLEYALPDCLALLIPSDSAIDFAHAHWLAQHFPQRSWIAVELLYGANDHARLAALQRLAQCSGLPLVAAGDVHMHISARQPLQDVLTAIRHGIPVHECGHLLYPNAERHLRPRVRLAQIYPRALLEESLRIAAACDFSLDELKYEYPDEVIPPGESLSSYLRKEVERGLQRRYGDAVPPAVREQIGRELRLIADKNYEPYFLTVYDIVNFAREHKILCQGRGSAANSAVCYALGITEIDPARSSMLFERFISRERNEPPDIDVDFEHDRREEVIQYIYDKYGRDRAALAATVIRYRPRSAVRDVGKALGFNKEEVEQLAKSLTWWDTPYTLQQRFSDAGLTIHPRKLELLRRLMLDLCGFPRHLSQHVGGFVITRGPLSELVPIENAAMKERCVVQWEKDDLEALCIMKVDVLALGILSVIRRSLEYIHSFYGRRLKVQDIPQEDPKVYAMIRAADTIGVFQIESRAQMSMLPRLKPRCYYDLVVQVAIVRPGPIQGGMVHPYLERRERLAREAKLPPEDYLSPAVAKVLERTLGVPIFQEQVMQLAVVAAGFSAGKADELRRAMASWHKRGSMEAYKQELLTGMRNNGYPEEFAQRLFQQICGFGEYGFPESHSASFALLAYQSAWLKCHYPAAFLAALLNSQPMGFYTPSQLVQDARRHGVEVRPVDVCSSGWDSHLERNDRQDAAVRLGLRLVKGLSQAGAARLVAARQTRPFHDVADLSLRAELGARDLQCLARAGALHALAGHRHNAQWLAAGIHHQSDFLRNAPATELSPALPSPAEAADISADYETLGLSLGRHPLALLRSKLRLLGCLTAAELQGCPNGRRIRISGLVTGRQRPGTASGTIFVTLEDETGNSNIVVWADLAERQRSALLESRLLTVQGVLERKDRVVHVVARKLVNHSHLLGTLQLRSRDFH